MEDPSPRSPKRSVDTISDEPAKESPEKRADAPCARCGCIQNVTFRAIQTTAREIVAPLCERCLSFDDGSDLVLCVLSALQGDTGLPLLTYWDKSWSRYHLGLFQDRSPFSNCSVCRCTAGVIKCHPIEFVPKIGINYKTKSTVDLCVPCRTCNKCHKIASADQFVDPVAHLCDNCAWWCTSCDRVADERHFQRATQPGGMPLCAKVCCFCQVRDAVVRHPTSNRAYCADCAENGRCWIDEDDEEEYPADESGWGSMLDLLRAQQKK